MYSTTEGLGNEVTVIFFNEFEKSCDRSSDVYHKNVSGDCRYLAQAIEIYKS